MADTLNDNALTTPDRVSELTGNDLPVALINAASSWVINECDRAFHRGDVTEDIPGYGLASLVVSRTPIVSVTSIAFNGTLLSDISDVVIEDSGLSGKLSRPGGWRWTAQTLPNITETPLPGTEQPMYQVIYRAGYITPWQVDVTNPSYPITAVAGATVHNLPTDLELAVIAVAQSMVEQLSWGGKNVKSERLMSWSASYNYDTAIPIVRDAIAKYRRIHI